MGCCLQEMDGKDCEGRYLGVKLDKYSNPGSEGDGREGLEMDQPSPRARSARPSKYSASHQGRQVSPCSMLDQEGPIKWQERAPGNLYLKLWIMCSFGTSMHCKIRCHHSQVVW